MKDNIPPVAVMLVMSCVTLRGHELQMSGQTIGYKKVDSFWFPKGEQIPAFYCLASGDRQKWLQKDKERLAVHMERSATFISYKVHYKLHI